jgi:hypothetical protein
MVPPPYLARDESPSVLFAVKCAKQNTRHSIYRTQRRIGRINRFRIDYQQRQSKRME